MVGAGEQCSELGHGMSGFWASIGNNFLCDLGQETSFLFVSIFLCIIIREKRGQVDS